MPVYRKTPQLDLFAVPLIAFALQAVRDKVIANLAASLEKAASELKKEGHSEGLPDATEVATAVEQALQKQFSKFVCKAQLADPFCAARQQLSFTFSVCAPMTVAVQGERRTCVPLSSCNCKSVQRSAQHETHTEQSE